MATVSTLDETLWEELRQDETRLSNCVFLEPHETFARQWKVNSFDITYQQRLDGALSKYDSFPYIRFPKFVEACEEAGYEIVFMTDPQPMYDWLDLLSSDPGVAINSSLEGGSNRLGEPLEMVNGMLKFQAIGVNFQKTCERMCWLQWSTGSGKTIGAEGTILWRREHGYDDDKGFDLCLIFAKPNNLVGTQRKLKEHTDLDGIILKGTPKQREKLFMEIATQMVAGEQPIVILTYEKLREDKDFFKLLVEDHNILLIEDEAPTKMRTRGTQIYKAAAEIFYTSFMVTKQQKGTKVTEKKIFYPKVGAERAKQMFALVTSATPIYNSPEDTFSVVRLVDPSIFGSVINFENTFVGRKNRWHQIVAWKNLDLMGEMLSHVVYQVDKDDADIAAMFPEVMPPEAVDLELHPDDQKLYDSLVAEYEKMKDNDLSILSRAELLAAIGCLQMLINNPRGVLASAIEREDYERELAAFVPGHTPAEITEFEKKHKRGSNVAKKLRQMIGDDARFTDHTKDGVVRNSKLEMLVEDISKNDSKVIVFSKFNEQNLPFISEALTLAGIKHVVFHGGLGDKARQEAIDSFKEDDSVKAFISSDAGGDSIDLEVANLTINYDLGWTWAGRTQRENRQHRIISAHDSVRVRTYYTPNSVEDRVHQIVGQKQGYHNQVFKGSIAEQANDLRSFSKKGLLYILTGREIDVQD